MNRGEVRARMVAGAVRLLATRGLEGTSFAEVLTLTDAPRGSVYHHFPGGKSELVHAGLDLAASRALDAMADSRGATTTWFCGSTTTRARSITCSRRPAVRLLGVTTIRSRSITRSRGAATGGATTTVGWVTM